MSFLIKPPTTSTYEFRFVGVQKTTLFGCRGQSLQAKNSTTALTQSGFLFVLFNLSLGKHIKLLQF